MNTEFLRQLETIRDALVDYADEHGLWQIVHAIDAVLEEHRDKAPALGHTQRRASDR